MAWKEILRIGDHVLVHNKKQKKYAVIENYNEKIPYKKQKENFFNFYYTENEKSQAKELGKAVDMFLHDVKINEVSVLEPYVELYKDDFSSELSWKELLNTLKMTEEDAKYGILLRCKVL